MADVADPSKWPPGWTNLHLVYYQGQGTKPSGAYAIALQGIGWTPSNGVLVQVTRSGPPTALTGPAQEV